MICFAVSDYWHHIPAHVFCSQSNTRTCTFSAYHVLSDEPDLAKSPQLKKHANEVMTTVGQAVSVRWWRLNCMTPAKQVDRQIFCFSQVAGLSDVNALIPVLQALGKRFVRAEDVVGTWAVFWNMPSILASNYWNCTEPNRAVCLNLTPVIDNCSPIAALVSNCMRFIFTCKTSRRW